MTDSFDTSNLGRNYKTVFADIRKNIQLDKQYSDPKLNNQSNKTFLNRPQFDIFYLLCLVLGGLFLFLQAADQDF
jgi:hypothetical protein